MQLIKLCSLANLSDRQAKGIVIGTGLEQQRFIVVMSGDEIRCYHNRCPHMGTPLDTFPDRFLDETGDFLVCSTHGARFNVADGVCITGPCVGQGLASCEISISDGQVYLAKKPDDAY